MVDEAGQVPHETRVDGPFRNSEVIKGIVHTQRLPKKIDVAVDDLSTVNGQQFSLLDIFSREETKSSARDGRPSYFCLFELLTHDFVIVAVVLIAPEAIGANVRTALLIV